MPVLFYLYVYLYVYLHRYAGRSSLKQAGLRYCFVEFREFLEIQLLRGV
ncbi:hypothetical protein SAMN02799616_03117 [Paenibacillus sp. UNC499MF]|nr:hypothetical protein SAMN02799616_03117 [Paenibacillus sp. UNC499MF]